MANHQRNGIDQDWDPKELARRLARRVCFPSVDPGPCALWNEGRTSTTGTITWGGRIIPAHRLAFALWHGLHIDDIAGDSIQHLCGQSMCCNVHHLRHKPSPEHYREDLAFHSSATAEDAKRPVRSHGPMTVKGFKRPARQEGAVTRPNFTPMDTIRYHVAVIQEALEALKPQS